MPPGHTSLLVHRVLGPNAKGTAARAHIHILDDDALFNIFCLYRTIFF
jgi:hypothetical protein